jgi:hypothetical protein
MRLSAVQCCRGFLASALALLFVFSPSLFAENHLVTPAEIQRELLKASRAREHNHKAVQDLLSSDAGQKALRSVHLDQVQVTETISNLNDAELARLAERAQQAQADFAAGALNKEELLIIAVAVVVVIIIVAVKA